MTREEAKELLPVIQAFAEGKEIQIKMNENKWKSIESCSFTSLPTFYRIKPEGESSKTTKLYESYE